MKKDKKKWMTPSNLIFLASILYAGGVMAKVYLDRSSLPPDVCPITSNNGWIYSAIILLALSIVATTILDRKKGKDDDGSEND